MPEENAEKVGFFSRVKQAFSKTREQSKEIQNNNEQVKERIMQKYELKLEQVNSEITELENILEQNNEKRSELEAERKEKLVEIVKTGKLKVRDLQELVENEVLLCSNPHLIIAQAKVSSLVEKLSKVLSFDIDKVFEEKPQKSSKKENSRKSGMDR